MNFIHTHRRITARHTLPPAHAPHFSTPQAGPFSLADTVPFPRRSDQAAQFPRLDHDPAHSSSSQQQNTEGRMTHQWSPEARERQRQRWSDPAFVAAHRGKVVRARHPHVVAAVPSELPPLECASLSPWDVGECRCGASVVRGMERRDPECSNCRAERIEAAIAARRRAAA